MNTKTVVVWVSTCVAAVLAVLIVVRGTVPGLAGVVPGGAWLGTGVLLSVIAAITRLWPWARLVLWARVKPELRPWLTVVPAVLGFAATVLVDPGAWLDQMEKLLSVVVPLIVPGALPDGAAHDVSALQNTRPEPMPEEPPTKPNHPKGAAA